jgi:hypothetical protein
VPNPWNPKRVLYLYVANSGLQLWHMTRTFQRNLGSWALFRGPDVSGKGLHDLDALAQELTVTEGPAPAVSQPTP